jgi:hypothetical protein
MEREALKLALEWFQCYADKSMSRNNAEALADEVIEAIKAALAQPAHSEWNAALDEAAARIGEIKGFGQATQDSFAVFIQGLKK